MALPTLACTISSDGISSPTYAEILQSLQESMRTIFGSDIYIAEDSQDGQMVAMWAQAIYDGNQADIATFNSFSPSYAQGAGLSSNVKINGIRRLIASNSTAVGDVIGVVGTVITDGTVADEDGNLWSLPASVTIGISGAEQVTVTAQEVGAIRAPAGTINTIRTPTRGWQQFESTADAVPGNPVESDAELRRRQTQSTSLPAQTPTGALYGALANLEGVDRVQVYENPTGAPDADGLPAHSISVVIEGGDVEEIAETIGQKKTPGAATYGTTTEDYMDPVTGISTAINFFLLDNVTIKVVVTGAARAGYSTSIGDSIKTTIAEYINGLVIGADVQYSRMFMPAYLNGALNGNTYEVTSITIARDGDAPGVIDLPIAFNEAAAADADVDVTVTIT